MTSEKKTNSWEIREQIWDFYNIVVLKSASVTLETWIQFMSLHYLLRMLYINTHTHTHTHTHTLFPGFPGVTVVRIPMPVQQMQEMWIRFLGQEDALEKEMAIHSRILAWKIKQDWLIKHLIINNKQLSINNNVCMCVCVCVCIHLYLTHTWCPVNLKRIRRYRNLRQPSWLALNGF